MRGPRPVCFCIVVTAVIHCQTQASTPGFGALGVPGGVPLDISADGSVVVGYVDGTKLRSWDASPEDAVEQYGFR